MFKYILAELKMLHNKVKKERETYKLMWIIHHIQIQLCDT